MESAQPDPNGNGAGDPIPVGDGLSGAGIGGLAMTEFPPQSTAAQPAVDAADPGAQLRVASRTADALAQLLREIEGHVGALQSQAQDAQTQLQQTDDGTTQLEAYKAAVLQAAGDLKPEDVSSMRELVEALARKPSDLLVMVKLAEQAGTLAAIVGAQERLLTLLRENQ